MIRGKLKAKRDVVQGIVGIWGVPNSVRLVEMRGQRRWLANVLV